MRYEVLYQRHAVWLVGESKAQAATRRADSLSSSTPAMQYPNDYPGRVVSLQPVGRKPSLRNMAGQLLQVAEIDLAEDDLAAVQSHSAKIAFGMLSAVTFDDRWGQVAGILRNNFDDAERAESEVTDEASFDGMRFGEVSAMAKGMLAKTRTETGTGLYATKATPDESR